MFGSVSVNQVLRDTTSAKEYRILHISEDRRSGFWIELSKDGGMPDVCNISEIDAMLAAGVMSQISDEWIPPVRASEKSMNQRDFLWDHLRKYLECEPEIFDKNSRKEMLQKAADECGIAVPNLYPKLKRYWRYGKVRDAFLYSDDRKGGKGKSRLLKRNSGRRPSETAVCSKVLTEEDLTLFDKYIRKYYLNRKKNMTLHDVYDLLIREKYSDVVKEENGIEKIVSWGMNRAPTFRQFHYWYTKFRDGNQETVARKGTSALNLKERAITGKSDFGMTGPGYQYQIDATVADIYLVSQFNRKNIIGRPVVYFVMDVFSRMVTGMYIGLEGPSWMGMAMALYNAFTDKVNYCHSYGIEITEDSWPSHHLPQSILGDRGELESINGGRIADRLNIRIDNTPPYRGDLKPVVERYFRCMNDTTVHRLPAHVRPDMSQRGGHDYRLDAKLDLRQFTRIMIFNVLTYNKSTLESLEPSEDMMKAGIELTPVSLWKWGMNCSSGLLRTVDESICRYALLPEDTCEITRRGIKFRKLYYTCERAAKEQWFENACRNGTYKMKVSYDPRDMHAVYVWPDESEKPEYATLLDWEQKFDGKSCDECDYEMDVISLQKQKNRQKDRDAKLTLDHYVDSVVAEAEAMAPDTSGSTKSERIAGINSNHQNEKDVMRQKETFMKDNSSIDSFAGGTGKGNSAASASETVNETKASNTGTVKKTDSSNAAGSLTEHDNESDTRGMRKMTKLEKMLWGIEDDADYETDADYVADTGYEAEAETETKSDSEQKRNTDSTENKV